MTSAATELGWRATFLIWLATGLVFGVGAQLAMGRSASSPATWLIAIIVAIAMALGTTLARALPKVARRLFP